MYRISDYLRNGLLFVNKTLHQQHKRLTQLMICSTTLTFNRAKKIGDRHAFAAASLRFSDGLMWSNPSP